MQTYTLPENMPADAKITLNRLQNLKNGLSFMRYADIAEYKDENAITSVFLSMNTYGPAVFYTFIDGRRTRTRFETNFLDQQTRKVANLTSTEIVEYAQQLANLLGVRLTISENFRRWENPNTQYTLRIERAQESVYKISAYECDAFALKQVADMLKTEVECATGSYWTFAHWAELSEAFLLDLSKQNIFLDATDLKNLRLPVKA